MSLSYNKLRSQSYNMLQLTGVRHEKFENIVKKKTEKLLPITSIKYADFLLSGVAKIAV